MDRDILEEFRRILTSIGIKVDAELMESLELFHSLLERWNRRVRLVGSCDERTLAVKHFVDSLTLIPFLDEIPSGGRVLDVGSGAGFPGIPLAVARSDIFFTLVESDSRKASFLLSMVSTLRLGNVSVIHARAGGDPCKEGIPTGNLVVSRALMGIEQWLPLGRRYLAEAGALAAMMGATAPEDEKLRCIGHRNGLVLRRVWRASLPVAGERAIAIWERDSR